MMASEFHPLKCSNDHHRRKKANSWKEPMSKTGCAVPSKVALQHFRGSEARHQAALITRSRQAFGQPLFLPAAGVPEEKNKAVGSRRFLGGGGGGFPVGFPVNPQQSIEFNWIKMSKYMLKSDCIQMFIASKTDSSNKTDPNEDF